MKKKPSLSKRTTPRHPKREAGGRIQTSNNWMQRICFDFDLKLDVDTVAQLWKDAEGSQEKFDLAYAQWRRLQSIAEGKGSARGPGRRGKRLADEQAIAYYFRVLDAELAKEPRVT